MTICIVWTADHTAENLGACGRQSRLAHKLHLIFVGPVTKAEVAHCKRVPSVGSAFAGYNRAEQGWSKGGKRWIHKFRSSMMQPKRNPGRSQIPRRPGRIRTCDRRLERWSAGPPHRCPSQLCGSRESKSGLCRPSSFCVVRLSCLTSDFTTRRSPSLIGKGPGVRFAVPPPHPASSSVPSL